MKNVVGIFLGIGCIADGRFVHPVGGFPNGLDIAKRCRRNEAAEGFTPKNDQRDERSTWPGVATCQTGKIILQYNVTTSRSFDDVTGAR